MAEPMSRPRRSPNNALKLTRGEGGSHSSGAPSRASRARSILSRRARLNAVLCGPVVGSRSMHRRPSWLAAVLIALVSSACITGVKQPLSVGRDSFIDQQLIGTWHCVPTDDSDPTDLTFVEFDSWQYLLQASSPKDGLGSYRVVATRIADATFLSARSIAPKAEDEWKVLQ